VRKVGHTARKNVRRSFEIIVLKPQGKGPLRRPSHRRKDNMVVDITIIVVLSRLDSCDSEQLTVARFCEYGDESSCSTENR